MHSVFRKGKFMRSDFDPYTLRLFLSVCEEGSIVRCADREATVASAVSKRMASLEGQVGLILLRRGARGMEATEAGQALARHAREVLGSMERMRTAMSDLAHGGEGSVTILSGLAPLSSSLPQDIVTVLQQHQSLKIRLKQAASTEMVRLVREGSADLGICWDAADLSELEAIPYREDHACVVVQNRHPLSRRSSVAFSETLDYEHISAMPGSMMEIMLRRYAAVTGKSIAAHIEVQSFEAVVRIAAAGFGVAILTAEVAEPFARDLPVKLIPLSDQWARRRFVICFRKEPYVSRAALLVAEALRQRLTE